MRYNRRHDHTRARRAPGPGAASAHPGAGRRHGHHDPGPGALRGGLRRGAVRGLQREPEPHPPGRRHRHPRGVSRGGRGPGLDQHLRLRALRPGRVRPRRALPRDHAGRRAALPGRGGSRLDARAAALRDRRHGAGDPHDHGHRQRHLRGGARRLLPSGARAHRGPGRRAPARDLPGHPERQGGRDRGAAGHGRGGPRAAAHGQRHRRADGDDAGRAGGRRLLRVDRAPRPVLGRAQLLDRPRVHDRPPAHARGARHLLRLGVPERGAPRRARPL